jgi:hypothetical protein
MTKASRPREQPPPAGDAIAAVAAVAAVLDDFHDAASRADGARYFGHFAADGVFLGTDPAERWTVAEFREYAEPHFSAGRGWTYAPLDDRRVSIAPCGTTAWFDERLRNDKYGECRGTGVLVMSEGGGSGEDDVGGGGGGGEWRFAQYNLTVPIPNDMLADVAHRIREYGTPAGHIVPTSQNAIAEETLDLSETLESTSLNETQNLPESLKNTNQNKVSEETQDICKTLEKTSQNTIVEETQDLSETLEDTTQYMIAKETQVLPKTLESSCIISEMPPSSSYRPKSSSLPTSLVRTIQLEGDCDDDEKRHVIPTTVVVQLFSDRIFLSITQLSGKMGSLLVCNVEESIIDNSTTYHVSTLLGTGAPLGSGGSAEQEVSMREVYVRRLAERIVSHARRMAGVREGAILGGAENGTSPIPSVVVGLGLRPNKSGRKSSFESFNAIVDAAMELYEEGWRICHSGGMVGMEGPD